MTRCAALAVAMAMAIVAAGGCGNAPAGGAGAAGSFLVSGSVRGAQTSGSGLAVQGLMNGAVTHVMAVTPSSQDITRVVAPIEADGTFQLQLAPDRAWVLVFIDSTRVGKDMILGIFKAGAMDSLAPTRGGHADLGHVAIE